jgi:predicted ester cyclase
VQRNPAAQVFVAAPAANGHPTRRRWSKAGFRKPPERSHRPKEEAKCQQPRKQATKQRSDASVTPPTPAMRSSFRRRSTSDELVEPDALMRTPLPIEATGAQLLKEVFARLLRAYPDLHITIEDLVEEGDKVVCRDTVTGTHQGEYMGIPPTGKSVTYDEIFIARFAGGRIAETWGVVDVLSQMRQLGAIPGGAS